MTQVNIALVRGFDLFFADVSAKSIESIAKNLGGRYSFSHAEGRATYMFENSREVPLTELNVVHNIVNSCGAGFASTYACQFKYSELYVTVSKKSVVTLKNKSELIVFEK